jgi:hypothetical protein
MIKRVGDILMAAFLFPLLIGVGLILCLYFMVRFPLWWIERAYKTRKTWLKWRDIDIV